jgi:hypothetical protein
MVVPNHPSHSTFLVLKPLVWWTTSCGTSFAARFTAFGRGFKAKDQLVQMLKERLDAWSQK